MFTKALEETGHMASVRGVVSEMFGSLGATGKGHGTDTAVLLGLAGHEPDTVDVDAVPSLLASIRESHRIALANKHEVEFNERTDLLLYGLKALPFHPNGMRFSAFDGFGRTTLEKTYYSVGGGFVVSDVVAADGSKQKVVAPAADVLPLPFHSGNDLLGLTQKHACSIADVMRKNELHWRSEEETDRGLMQIWDAMKSCVERGVRTSGHLPGPLRVRRRAAALAERLGDPRATMSDPLAVMDWVNLYALAVNEENASGGRVVTAPTNGAAGIVPAVLHYYVQFVPGADEQGVRNFLLTAAAIGLLYKENASISGAEVGCQGEVGVACSMAAAGLCAVLGGDPRQVENAAEIGMEHHLGLTCDPVGGLVQIPCIERNAVASVKAINAARMALHGDGVHHVSLDQVIKTMRETGADMMTKYKETSRGGLAVNIVEC